MEEAGRGRKRVREASRYSQWHQSQESIACQTAIDCFRTPSTSSLALASSFYSLLLAPCSPSCVCRGNLCETLPTSLRSSLRTPTCTEAHRKHVRSETSRSQLPKETSSSCSYTNLGLLTSVSVVFNHFVTMKK